MTTVRYSLCAILCMASLSLIGTINFDGCHPSLYTHFSDVIGSCNKNYISNKNHTSTSDQESLLSCIKKHFDHHLFSYKGHVPAHYPVELDGSERCYLPNENIEIFKKKPNLELSRMELIRLKISLLNTVETAKKEIAAKRNELETLQKTAPDYKTKTELLYAEIGRLQTRTNTLNASIGALTCQEQDSKQRAAITPLLAEKESITYSIDHLKKEISTIEEYQRSIGKIKSRINDLKETISKIPSLIEQLDTAIGILTTAETVS